jgi:hypothetical protein
MVQVRILAAEQFRHICCTPARCRAPGAPRDGRTRDRRPPVRLPGPAQPPEHVLPPPCPVSVPPLDFSHAKELIDLGYVTTTRWLAKGGDRLPRPERFLAFHHHGHEQQARTAAQLPERVIYGGADPGVTCC